MTKNTKDITSTIAKSDDATIQITFTVPKATVQAERKKALETLVKDADIPGFRKGKAPLNKVEENVGEDSITQQLLNQILPKAFSDAVTEYKIKPIMYPKFELISVEKQKDWQIRAKTCELPEIDLGDYKKIITGEARSENIWTPDKGVPEKDKKEPSVAEKEQLVIGILLKNTKIDIPKILIDEEVNSKLSKLLERIEKLGLDLEKYLESIGKNFKQLRTDYEKQSADAISLELILNKIAVIEKIKVKDEDVEAAIKASSADPELQKKLDTPQQRNLIMSVLTRRASLDSLTSLI